MKKETEDFLKSCRNSAVIYKTIGYHDNSKYVKEMRPGIICVRILSMVVKKLLDLCESKGILEDVRPLVSNGEAEIILGEIDLWEYIQNPR